MNDEKQTPIENEVEEGPVSPELEEQHLDEVHGGLGLRRAGSTRVRNAPRITIRVEPI